MTSSLAHTGAITDQGVDGVRARRHVLAFEQRPGRFTIALGQAQARAQIEK